MTITEVIKNLQEIKDTHGDLEVRLIAPEGYWEKVDSFELEYYRNPDWSIDYSQPPYSVILKW